MGKDSYDRILEKLDNLLERVDVIEMSITDMLDKIESDVVDNRKTTFKKAKDLPIGTKVRISEANLSVYEVIAHSKGCDEVAILENDEGHIVTENVNDVLIVGEVE